jgi:hypothetical protein
MDDQRPADIPSDLDHLIQLNVAYQVLICPHNECRKAVQPRAFSEHLRVQHQTPLRDRERVQEYISIFSWDYDFSTIQLPGDGSRPQPVVPVIDGFQCRTCPFKSSNRKSMKVHGNKEHQKQRVGDNELFRKVRLQSWFQDHRQRYWVVDEGEEVPEAVVNKVIEVVVNEGLEAVVGGEVGEEVVDDDEEVFSAFDNSGDEDYRESSEDVVGEGEGGSSEVEVDGSDDEDYEESSGVVDVDEEEGSSEVDVDRSNNGVQSSAVADDDEVVMPVDHRDGNPSRKWRAGKRKMQSKFEDSGRWRGTKRQKRMSWFEDSGVVMESSQNGSEMGPNSQDDDIVPPSSPPIFGWMIGKGLEGVDDGLRLPEPSTVVRVTNDDDGDDENDVPSQLRFGCQHGGTVQSRLDHLEERLEKWCRTCPACYLAGDFGGEIHHMSDCWRRGTVEIIDQAVIMQQHITKFGGFRGGGGCPWCGVPRAICQQWHVSTEGGGKEEPGQQCQYIGMLVPAVITMLIDGCNEGWAVFGSWMDRDGVIWAKEAEVYEWFRQGIWWEGIEVARIVRVFYMLVNKNRGVGRT